MFVHNVACSFEGDVIVAYIDLESSGLDVLSDEILEIAATVGCSQAQFSAAVRPVELPTRPGVHGICDDELSSSAPFRVVFYRMLGFLRDVAEEALVDDESSSEDDAARPEVQRLPMPKFPPPPVVLAAHNGFKFDFPMLVSEVLKHDCNIYLLADFKYVDTLEIVRACGLGVADGCAKLQCLGRCAGGGGLRAHRALEDTVVLGSVVRHVAESLGTSESALVKLFARDFDVCATLAGRMLL